MSENAINEMTLASKPLVNNSLADDLWHLRLSVPTMHCAGCMAKIEKTLMQRQGVCYARVNLTGKFVDIQWQGQTAPDVLTALTKVGHQAHIYEGLDDKKDAQLSTLIRAVAVAGFATSNVMLMSVAVWAGADGFLKEVFHYVSALIAFPVLLYSGRLFFKPAWAALRHGHTNMDVPISIGVILAFCMSLYDTFWGQGAVYFEASVMLLFFLLIGRTLDHMMREKARNAVAGLAALLPKGAWVQQQEGDPVFLALDAITKGMIVKLSPQERVPLDGRVVRGVSSFDCAMVTGESVPLVVQQGSDVLAGMLNMQEELYIEVTADKDQSFLSKTIALMENTASSKSTYRSMAERVVRLYAPVVHSAAFIAFVVWMVIDGDWHKALTVAIAVLIITCPCALGLAVPIVHVVAVRRLFNHGVLTRSGSALERLTAIDTVIFDKTGTLTTGEPTPHNGKDWDDQALSYAASLGAHSSHPYSKALVRYAHDQRLAIVPSQFEYEKAGHGIQGDIKGQTYRLGRAQWALDPIKHQANEQDLSQVVLSCQGQLVATFLFEDAPRPSASDMISDLQRKGFALKLISGDAKGPVETIADQLGFHSFSANNLPADKVDQITTLTQQGHKVLMVGDGLNDAPALAAAHVSMTPSSAADIGRASADFVFLNGDLKGITAAIDSAHKAQRLIHQNFILAVIYNVLALPLAFLALVTPMIAAIAMSVSSIIVVLNALRLNRRH